MGYPLTSPSDYTGIIAISTNKYTKKDLEAYILTYEQDILESLLGCDMAAELIVDLDVDNQPQDPKFIDIFNPFCVDDKGGFFIHGYPWFYDYHPNYDGWGCRIQWKSKGILELLKYQVFFYFTRDQQVVNSVVGNVKNV